MAPASTSTSRIVDAAPATVFAALISPEALVAWLPPGGMTGRMHAFDAGVGGGYSMSLFYPSDDTSAPGKTTALEDRVEVKFIEVLPPWRIVEAVTFVSDDPAYGGEMIQTIALAPAAAGATMVTLDFQNLPPGVRPEDNEEGARQSLEQLARWLEPKA